MKAPRTQLLLVITEEGQFQITGPLENKLLCYGMLELARDSVQNHRPNIVRPDDEAVRKLSLVRDQ